jgi:hypothetical protein
MPAEYHELSATDSGQHRQSVESSGSISSNNDGRKPRMERSGTVNSLAGFDFRESVLPLTLSAGEEEVNAGHGVVKGDERHVGLLHGQL